jgi:hypothetical protein
MLGLNQRLSMIYDDTATDPCFHTGRPPANIEELLLKARRQLGLNEGNRHWRLISARKKFRKVLFEIQEITPHGTPRLIGKIGKPDRIKNLYRTLTELRAAGFRPPARLTVPEPLDCIEDQGFILQEKAPGVDAASLILNDAEMSIEAASGAALWLAALHRSAVPTWQCITETGALNVEQELARVLPDKAEVIHKIISTVQDLLKHQPSTLVPSHGDFHPRNVLIHAKERITVIDIDKFGLAEREYDVASFLVQTAIFDFMCHVDFVRTINARRMFMHVYEGESGYKFVPGRVGAYIALGFLRKLHYELVLLRTGREQYVDPWLRAASAALDGDLTFSG